MGLTLPEQNLMVELAVGLARRLNEVLGSGEGDHVGEGYLHHMYQSDFEVACDTLWRLGVARAAYQDAPNLRDLALDDPRPKEKINFPPYFKTESELEIRAALSHMTGEPSVSLDDLLSAFLGVVCDYGEANSQFSTERGLFVPPVDYVREVDRLVRTGYMERIGYRVQWTDKATTAMHSTRLWDEFGRSYKSLEADALDRAARLAWETMPETVRLSYFSGPEYRRLNIVDLLRRAWKNDTWEFGGDVSRGVLSNQLHLADRLIEIAQGKR